MIAGACDDQCQAEHQHYHGEFEASQADPAVLEQPPAGDGVAFVDVPAGAVDMNHPSGSALPAATPKVPVSMSIDTGGGHVVVVTGGPTMTSWMLDVQV